MSSTRSSPRSSTTSSWPEAISLSALSGSALAPPTCEGPSIRTHLRGGRSGLPQSQKPEAKAAPAEKPSEGQQKRYSRLDSRPGSRRDSSPYDESD